MPAADVVVIGAGLAGLTAAVELAERGATVHVAATGLAAISWAHGGLDVAAPPGAPTSADGLAMLRRTAGHPYRLLHADAEPALAATTARLAAAGLPYTGDLETPLRPFPTPVGGLRPAAILPAAQAPAVTPWARDEGLLLLGIGRYRDAWPEYAARNLARQDWADGPVRIEQRTVLLPGLERLRNLGSLVLARRFDEPAWRAEALAALARAVPVEGRWRIGLPAVLGLERHAEVLAEATAVLGAGIFEIPTLPPSIPGLRLHAALRARARELGVSLQVGFAVVGVQRDGARITAVETHAAARPLRIRTEAVVLATGGIAGGGLRGTRAGAVVEPVLGLAVSAAGRADWLAGDLYASGGVPLETAGIVVDDELRPVADDGAPRPVNVRVIGSALAGMRYLSERCGDGVALASAHRAARLLAGEGAGTPPAPGVIGPTGAARRKRAARTGAAGGKAVAG